MESSTKNDWKRNQGILGMLNRHTESTKSSVPPEVQMYRVSQTGRIEKTKGFAFLFSFYSLLQKKTILQMEGIC